MKKLLSYIILGALVILSAQGLVSCKVVERMSMQADSSANRSEQTTEKWNREVIREYLPGQADTVHAYHQVDPKIIQLPGTKTIYRETIRDQGEKTSNLDEVIKTMLSQKEVTKEPAPWIPWVILGIGFMVLLTFSLLVLVVLHRLFKR
jgi:cytoskeletal protein RodZ